VSSPPLLVPFSSHRQVLGADFPLPRVQVPTSTARRSAAHRRVSPPPKRPPPLVPLGDPRTSLHHKLEPLATPVARGATTPLPHRRQHWHGRAAMPANAMSSARVGPCPGVDSARAARPGRTRQVARAQWRLARGPESGPVAG
jgi:hypothetical protein